MRRFVFPLILGLGGMAILCALGFWQVQRLEWKRGVLARIEAQIAAEPEPLPAPGEDTRPLKYHPVTVSGQTAGPEIHVLSGMKGIGAGYEVITALVTPGGRRVLLDRGFLPEAAKGDIRPPVDLAVIGNLHWPEETTGSTPEPDLGRNIWFARDVPKMAEALGTEPVLIVAREIRGAGQGILAVPVSTAGIPNDHQGYAVTWFSLALVWAGMTSYLLWRIRQKTI